MFRIRLCWGLLLVSLWLGWGADPVWSASGFTPAPVFPDYLERSQVIGSYEDMAAKTPNFIALRLLAGEYLKRFRERQDVEDLLRAERAARQSLRLQPQHNGSASLLLASALLAQHRFREALQQAKQAVDPAAPASGALLASLQMEVGNYPAAHELLSQLDQQADPGLIGNPGLAAVQARYQELTGDLAGARIRMEKALQQVDQFYTNPAELRAWFHVRVGDLAFLAGDLTASEKNYREALALYPQELPAFTGLARLYAAQHEWQKALEVATQGSELVPLVENLAYKADAQRALGQDPSEAEALIDVVAHLSQVKGIYDRALAMYYSDHALHLPEALKIARREKSVRDDLYAEDTLAWAAAMNGRWTEAQRAIQKALSFGTQDPLLHFHAGVIALHTGQSEEGIRQLQQALDLNPQFHFRYADEARQLLATLQTSSSS